MIHFIHKISTYHQATLSLAGLFEAKIHVKGTVNRIINLKRCNYGQNFLDVKKKREKKTYWHVIIKKMKICYSLGHCL